MYTNTRTHRQHPGDHHATHTDAPPTPASNGFAPVVRREYRGRFLLKQQYWVRPHSLRSDAAYVPTQEP
jgi:hypothetical protein